LKKFTGNRHRRAKQAAAEVMGAVLLIGATLAVGFAVWAYARSASSNAEKNFASEINTNVDCLNANFVIINANFNSTNPSIVTLWFYNTGSYEIHLSNVVISSSTNSQLYSGTITGLLKPAIVYSVTLTTGSFKFSGSTIYNFQAEAQNTTINCAVYSQAYPQTTPATV
jgi:hypothetical protein